MNIVDLFTREVVDRAREMATTMSALCLAIVLFAQVFVQTNAQLRGRSLFTTEGPVYAPTYAPETAPVEPPMYAPEMAPMTPPPGLHTATPHLFVF